MKKITAIIPCYNEAAAITDVINKFPRQKLLRAGFQLDILVVDNNSSDDTAALATAAGARVVREIKQGKGHGLKTGFYNIAADTDYIIMLDGDDTYKPEEMMRLIEPLDSGFASVIIGSRMHGRMSVSAMKRFNHFGNRLYSRLVRTTYRVMVSDTLTGYMAWTREAVENLRPHLVSSGFTIEMEMVTKLARLGYGIYSVPVSYEPRLGSSSLRPVRDGLKIMGAYGRYVRWQPEQVHRLRRQNDWLRSALRRRHASELSRPKRIALVSDAVLPFNKGGKETRIYHMSQQMKKQGFTVDIYTMNWWQGDKAITHDGITYHAISKFHPLYSGKRRSIWQAVCFAAACLKLVRYDFDVLEVDHMPYLLLFSTKLVSIIKRKPLYATWHEVWGSAYWQEYFGTVVGKAAAIIEKISARLPDHITAVSAMTYDRLGKELGYTGSIALVVNGIEIQQIAAIQPAARKSDVIYVGRLLHHKHVDALLEAIAVIKQHRRLNCLIVGDGPEYGRLKRMISDLGLEDQVTMLGFLESSEEVLAHIKASKVYVLPSTRVGFGISILEALACGKRVVTIDHPDNAARHLVPSEAGTVCALDPKALAKAIEAELTKTRRKNYAQYVQGYDWSNSGPILHEIYS